MYSSRTRRRCTVNAHLLLKLICFICLNTAVSASAQNKWVDKEGRVNYSDLPPPASVSSQQMNLGLGAQRHDAEGIPDALKKVIQSHPVVLYTTSDCVPCQQARTQLSKRGIPYDEKTITAASDLKSFRQLGFAQDSFPSLSVGSTQSQGFESSEWNRLLDKAGYPESTVLPPTYKQPPAAPLAGRESGQTKKPKLNNSVTGTQPKRDSGDSVIRF